MTTKIEIQSQQNFTGAGSFSSGGVLLWLQAGLRQKALTHTWRQ